MADTRTYRLLRGEHRDFEDGRRVLKTAGDLIELSDAAAAAFRDKIEPVNAPENHLDNTPDALDNSEPDSGDALPLTLEDVLIDGTRDAKILDALYGAGIGSVDTVRGMTDDELRDIPGIGPASVTRLRELIS